MAKFVNDPKTGRTVKMPDDDRSTVTVKPKHEKAIRVNNPVTGEMEWKSVPTAQPSTVTVRGPTSIPAGFENMYKSERGGEVVKVQTHEITEIKVNVPEHQTAEERAKAERDGEIDRKIAAARQAYEDTLAERDGKSPAHSGEMRATYKPKPGER